MRFKEVSGMPWAEIARRLGADPKTVRRWRKDGVLANAHYLLALQDLAAGYGLGHLFTELHTKGLANDNRHIRR